jgi:hypothetical protein
MHVAAKRDKVRFVSGDTECAAWHYPGTGACSASGGQLSFLRRHLLDAANADR